MHHGALTACWRLGTEGRVAKAQQPELLLEEDLVLSRSKPEQAHLTAVADADAHADAHADAPLRTPGSGPTVCVGRASDRRGGGPWGGGALPQRKEDTLVHGEG